MISRMSKSKEGGEVDLQKCRKFQNNIDNCELIDLGTEGPRYTWRGPLVKYASRLYKKLDRALCNGEWRMKFAEAKVRVGPRTQSDHHPLLISLTTGLVRRGERPFRFEAAWLTHEHFKEFVEDKWDKNKMLWETLGNLEKELASWNEHTFGYITKRKKELLRRIGGIQKSLQDHANTHLENLEMELHKELKEVLMQEEILWFQKARTKWLNDGDRNTTYYHLKTKIRRSRNRITSLKDEEDNWVEGRQEVGNLFNQYFQTLFSEEFENRRWLHTFHSWPTISEVEWDGVLTPISDEEIRQAIFSIGSLKAPGEDGFQAIFFKRCWEIVGSTVCESVRRLWQHPEEIKEVNKTLLCLILKIECPEKVK